MTAKTLRQTIQRRTRNVGLNLLSYIFEIEADRANALVKEDGGFKCIHLQVDDFVAAMTTLLTSRRMLRRIEKKENLRFLDVGCGVGQKVYIAQSIFRLNAFGLELRKTFVKRTRKFFHRLEESDLFYSSWLWKKIIQGDALTFQHYGDYDIIYFYCPIWDVDKEIELERRIARHAKVGCVVMGFSSDYFRKGIPGWREITRFNSHDYRTVILEKISDVPLPSPSDSQKGS